MHPIADRTDQSGRPEADDLDMVIYDEIDRGAIVREMDDARASLRRLLSMAYTTTLARRNVGTRWTNEQLLFHMVFVYMVVRALGAGHGAGHRGREQHPSDAPFHHRRKQPLRQMHRRDHVELQQSQIVGLCNVDEPATIPGARARRLLLVGLAITTTMPTRRWRQPADVRHPCPKGSRRPSVRPVGNLNPARFRPLARTCDPVRCGWRANRRRGYRRTERRLPIWIQISKTMTAPMNDPMMPAGCRKPSCPSLWKSR